jgi:hypothetical protein
VVDAIPPAAGQRLDGGAEQESPMRRIGQSEELGSVAVAEVLEEASPAGPPARRPVRPVLLPTLGGLFGLAWAAGLRGFMSEVAGPASRVDWAGTFGWILLPGVVTGVLLGWAESLRRTGGRRGWRWLALSPLVLAAVVLHRPWDVALLLREDPLGGGAVGVALYGLAAGYALSGRGRSWGRLACGALALTAIPLWAATVTGFGGPGLAVSTPRGLWVALYYWSFLAVLGIACAIPHRPVIARAAHSGRAGQGAEEDAEGAGTSTDGAYLVECMWPGVTEKACAEAAARAGAATQALAVGGCELRFVDGLLIPDDEVVLFRFAGGSHMSVEQVCVRAALPYERILEYTAWPPAERTDPAAAGRR